MLARERISKVLLAMSKKYSWGKEEREDFLSDLTELAKELDLDKPEWDVVDQKPAPLPVEIVRMPSDSPTLTAEATQKEVDKLINQFAVYVRNMDVNVWTGLAVFADFLERNIGKHISVDLTPVHDATREFLDKNLGISKDDLENLLNKTVSSLVEDIEKIENMCHFSGTGLVFLKDALVAELDCERFSLDTTDFSKALAALRDKLHASSSDEEVEELKSTVRSLEENIAAKENQIEDLESELVTSEERIEELTDELSDAETQLDSITYNAENVVEEFKSLGEQLDAEKDIDISDLFRHVDALADSIDSDAGYEPDSTELAIAEKTSEFTKDLVDQICAFVAGKPNTLRELLDSSPHGEYSEVSQALVDSINSLVSTIQKT